MCAGGLEPSLPLGLFVEMMRGGRDGLEARPTEREEMEKRQAGRLSHRGGGEGGETGGTPVSPKRRRERKEKKEPLIPALSPQGGEREKEPSLPLGHLLEGDATLHR